MKKLLLISLLMVGITGVLVASSLAASQAQEQDQVAVGEPFEIQGGEVVSVGEGDLLISDVAVVQDSRCPMNARCIVAGQAVVRLRVNGKLVKLGLWSDTVPSSLALADGYTIELLEVNPFPGSPEYAAGIPHTAVLMVSEN